MMIEDMLVSGLLSAMADHPFRSIAIDRPGFGYSGRTRGIAWTAAAQAKLLSQAFRHLQIQRSIVFGHSMGTMVALALALNHPDQISGLVLASGYYYPTARLDVALVSPPAVPLVGDLLCHTVAPLLGEAMAPRFIKKMFSPRPVPPRFYREFPVGLMLRPSQIRAATKDATHMIADANRMAKAYSEIACPTVIIAGDRDAVVDQRPQAQRLHAAMPGSVLDVLVGTGHMTHYADPERIVTAIEHVAHEA